MALCRPLKNFSDGPVYQKSPLEISKEYDVSFDGDLPETKDVLSIIIQILRAQASGLAPPAEEKG